MPITAAVARRFLVRRQLLAPPRALPPAPASVLEVVARLGSLQFDPLDVPGAKNHDLVLHARIAGMRTEWCASLLYGPAAERKLFEAYNKSLNLLPVDELPFYRFAWKRAEARYRETIFASQKETVRAILRRLDAEGPLSTGAISKDHGAHIDWHWAPTAVGRAVLEALFESGRVGIARRDGSKRTFDLIERLFPTDLLAKRVPIASSMAHRLLSRYRGVGLLGESANAEIFVGTGKAPERAAIVRRFVASGVLVPVEVEGLRGVRFVLAEELPLLEAAKVEPTPAHVSFIAPLDPLLWDRRLLRALFGFDYVWEVYTPEAKRRHGYYVLPILFGDRLIGRIEPRLTKATKVLHIAGVWFEEGFDPEAPAFVAAFADALAAYAAFVGAVRVSWTRGRVASRLRGALA